MNRDKALARIKKCLALAKSSNEHEAAAALRQAQALMREHGFDRTDVDLADVRECRSAARSNAVTRWEALLMHTIADAFGCGFFTLHQQKLVQMAGVYAHMWRKDVVFVGVDAAPELAAYAHDVLLRQVRRARMRYIGQQPRACKPITKTARGDEFARGWVYAVRAQVQRFAGADSARPLIELHLQRHYPHLQTVKPRDTALGRNARNADLEAGFAQGEKARLDRGLPAASTQPPLPGVPA